ncbi:peptide ABC transporter permease [Nitratireductor aestuarii]|uniref:Peptide ABC transporter permease n=1 Tax=Nitratireductor aestuarii TaxID=1735103 RepID=A0A916S065_9HYPH|nr:ABC transporter permease [Nitratireductor aestuarii]GGA78755.1 peptide ABC transporter permease [Nitratireductor aestuarii]
MSEVAGRRHQISLPQWATLPVVVGGFIVMAWIIIGLTVPLWAPYDPTMLAGRRFVPPGAEHWLGTDALGRDVFTRTLYGVRHSLPIAAAVIASAVVIGCTLGAIAGFVGGIVDEAIMRLVDVTLSFPAILLAMAVTAALGPGLANAAIAMIIVWWPIYARLMRAQVLAVREREHVEAAIASGATPSRVLFKHILPLCWSPIIVNATMDFGQVILLAASLSFIGLGAVPPTPEWGQMISDGALHFYRWWIAAGPGIAILTIVLGFNFLGDGLRDYLDPRSP